MITLSPLIITERFELPIQLEKQLENTALSALGYILSPHLEKYRKLIHSNRKLNDMAYKSVEEVVKYIHSLTKTNEDSKRVFQNVLMPDFFSVTNAKEEITKIEITVEKKDNDIYAESNEKKNRVFQSIVLSKDTAGWEMKPVVRMWNRLQDSYNAMKDEFDDQLVLIEDILRKVISWKNRGKPIIQKDGKLAYDMVIPNTNQDYWHIFRTVKDHKQETEEYPAHISPDTIPIIQQTIDISQFFISNLYARSFYGMIKDFINTSKHEARHLLQYAGDKQKGLPMRSYGMPKAHLKYMHKPYVRGVDSHSTADPNSPFKDPKDSYGRVDHAYRDVEHKTNLYNYKDEIETMLGANLPKNKWSQGFKNLLLYTIGRIQQTQFTKMFPYSAIWNYTIAKKHLEQLYYNDREKFDQVVKELYSLIFVDQEE